MSTLKAFLAEYVGWTAHHALLDPYELHQPLVSRWLIFARIAPLLIFAWPQLRHVPRTWVAVIGVTCLQILAVPEYKFTLQMLPFLVIMIAITLDEHRHLLWIGGAALLLCGLPRFIRQVHSRPYSIMDMYYYTDLLKKNNVEGPAWTSVYPIYFLMNWPVPNNNLLDLTPEESRMGRLDYANERTAVFLYTSWHKPEDWKGWTHQDIKLTRGLYHWMRIWRKT
jgi:hypothetical protein